MPSGYGKLYSKMGRGKKGGSKRSTVREGATMGAPKMGAMQTPARLASTRKMSGRRR
jgi:hypothetical protein